MDFECSIVVAWVTYYKYISEIVFYWYFPHKEENYSAAVNPKNLGENAMLVPKVRGLLCAQIVESESELNNMKAWIISILTSVV